MGRKATGWVGFRGLTRMTVRLPMSPAPRRLGGARPLKMKKPGRIGNPARAEKRPAYLPDFLPVMEAKNAFASLTSRFGSSAKALLSVSIAITPDHLLFLISAKRPA